MAKDTGVIIEKQDNWTSGMANDVYNADLDEFSRSKNVDVYYQVGRVRPYRGVEDYSGGQNDMVNIFKASDGFLYGINDDANPNIFSTNGGAPWDQKETVNDNLSVNNGVMFFEHQKYLYYWHNENANNVGIGRFEIATDTATDNWATIQDSRDLLPGPGFRHPLSDRAFFSWGHRIWQLDNDTDPPTFDSDTGAITGGTEPALGFEVPDEYQIVSLTHWDKYLVVGCKSLSGETSKAYFWNQYDVRADFVRDIPEGDLFAVRNIGGSVVALCTQLDVDAQVMAYVFTGGEFNLKRSIIRRNIAGNVSFKDQAVRVTNNTVFFGGEFDDLIGIFRFGLNKFGGYYMTLDRSASNAGTETSVIAIEIDNNTFYSIHTNNGTITRTAQTASYTLDSGQVYEESIRFFGGSKNKMYKKKWVSFGISSVNPVDETFAPAAHNLTLYYRTDANAAWTLVGVHPSSTRDHSKWTFQNTEITIIDYHTIQFRVEHDGLAQLTEFFVEHEVLPQDLTEQ